MGCGVEAEKEQLRKSIHYPMQIENLRVYHTSLSLKGFRGEDEDTVSP